VELRLTERAGEIRVAVRTADSHLAGTLRESLPALSSRLADSGFHAESWHPAASGSDWRRAPESNSSGLPNDSNSQSPGQGEQQQSGDNSRRPKVPHEQLEHKEKGKDFEWFMSSLQ
jgi:hypothetical protein